MQGLYGVASCHVTASKSRMKSGNWKLCPDRVSLETRSNEANQTAKVLASAGNKSPIT